MQWILNDGGRAEAGYKGIAGDCVTRAIAIATGRPYQQVYDELHAMLVKFVARKRKHKHSRSPRTGVARTVIQKYLQEYTWVPCMGIGTGCKVHLKTEELPSGTIIVNLSKHLATVIDGVLHDLSDCSRDGTRCVYGYWIIK